MDSGISSNERTSFEQFLRGDVQAELVAMEALRRKTLWTLVAGWTLTLAVAAGLLLQFGDSESIRDGVVFAAIVALVALHVFVFEPYRSGFKTRVICPLIRAYHGSLSYTPDGGISRVEFEAARMFREIELTDFSSEDLVAGRIGVTPFHFSEVRASRVTGIGRNRRETEIFSGLFFIADFNKHFSGATYVLPDLAQRLLGSLGQSLQAMNSRYGELVKLEDPEFERLFAVFGSNQIEPRYILSSALMERIVAYRKRGGHVLRLAFVNDRLYVAISLTRNLFEPRLFRTLMCELALREFWDDIALVTDIVEDLNLNTRIWSKSEAVVGDFGATG
jgi:hypothetical protein